MTIVSDSVCLLFLRGIYSSQPIFNSAAALGMQLGTKAFAELCDKYAHLGKLYEAPQMLKDKAAKGEAFFA